MKNLDSKLDGEHKNDKQGFLRMLIKRVRRVQFLRSFDIKCCLNIAQDENHEKFDKVLTGVDEELSERLGEIDNIVVT